MLEDPAWLCSDVDGLTNGFVKAPLLKNIPRQASALGRCLVSLVPYCPLYRIEMLMGHIVETPIACIEKRLKVNHNIDFKVR